MLREWLLLQLRLSEGVLRMADQRSPINAKSYDRQYCDDCGKVLDMQEGEDIFIELTHLFIPCPNPESVSAM